MGSIIMHLCLAKQVINVIKFKNKVKKLDKETNNIYIGSILPDFEKSHNKTRENSHYIIEIEKDGLKNKIPDIDLFLRINGQEVLKDNYILGELIHLVSDRLWYSRYIPKYAKNISEDGKILFDFKQKKNIEGSEFTKRIYDDYFDINYYLINKYKLDLKNIFNNEDNKEICEHILKNLNKDYNEKLDKKSFKNTFDNLNYMEQKDVEEWIKESKKEIFQIIHKINKVNNINKKGNRQNMKVIVGLGNIGKEYDKTRHNSGFISIDKLAKKYEIDFNKKMKKCIVGEGNINRVKVALVKPTTFMNLSGEAIVEIKNWYKLENSDILVMYDDIDIILGDVRYRKEGSPGTHNGMKDILAVLKTNELSRIRIGIENRKGLPIPLSDYVLSNFNKDEINILETDIFTQIDEKVAEFLDK